MKNKPDFDYSIRRLIPRRLAKSVRKNGRLIKKVAINGLNREMQLIKYRGATYLQVVKTDVD